MLAGFFEIPDNFDKKETVLSFIFIACRLIISAAYDTHYS